MTATLGTLAMVGGLAALVSGGVLALAGRRSAVAVTRVGAGLAAAAVAALAWALATGDLRLAYVAATTDRSTAWPHRLAGLWGGMGGSLLLWSAMVAAWSARRRLAAVERAAIAWLAAAFLLVDLVLATPWHRLAAPALDGLGPTPILRHPAMLYHPPVLYLGLTGLVVPWGATLAGAGGPGGDGGRVRRQLLAVLGVLTLGMVAGAHWAYVELGWGGFWAWDPVENTALLPWLAVVGALHGLRAGRRSGPVLVVVALALAVLGTTLTRSGAAPSVHAFGEDGAVGWALAAVVVAATAGSLALVLGRRGGTVRASGAVDRALRLQPWLAGFAVLVVLLGTLRPLVGDRAVAVDGSYYASLLGPVGLLAVVLALRARPGLLAHLAVALLALGVAGSTRAESVTATVEPGGAVDVAGWTVVHEAVEVVDDDTVRATVTLRRGDDRVATLHPRIVAHRDRGVELAETSLRSTPLTDVQVVLRNADDRGRALLEVHVRPLVWCVWGGGLLLAAAALAAARPGRLRYPTAAVAAAQSAASSARSAAASAP